MYLLRKIYGQFFWALALDDLFIFRKNLMVKIEPRRHLVVCSGGPELKSDQRAVSLRHRPAIDSSIESLNGFE
jgi:hypothetical protein